MTGFEYQTRQKAYILNKTNQLGFVRPFPSDGSPRGIFKTYAEIDLMQIRLIRDKLSVKHSLSRYDFDEIEPETTILDFAGETFFSLFPEQTTIY